MKQSMRKRKMAILIFMVGLLIIITGPICSEAGNTKISRPFEYAGYSSPEYKSYVRSSHYVSMFDGVKLAVDVYLPSDSSRMLIHPSFDNGDFFVYLEDVDEKGEAYYVTEGKLRAGFAGLVPQEDMLAPGTRIKVLPNLPYHGYKDTDYVEKIFAGGNIVELVFDLYPTSWIFKKGHRIRVSIACADWPTFDLHPKLSPKNDPNDPGNTVPTITVYRDAKHLSRIELPVIPSKRKVR